MSEDTVGKEQEQEEIRKLKTRFLARAKVSYILGVMWRRSLNCNVGLRYALSNPIGRPLCIRFRFSEILFVCHGNI